MRVLKGRDIHEPCWDGPVSHRVSTTHPLPGLAAGAREGVTFSFVTLHPFHRSGEAGRQLWASEYSFPLASQTNTSWKWPEDSRIFHTPGWRRSVATAVMVQVPKVLAKSDRNFASDDSRSTQRRRAA